jgi:hypothetical protein
MGSKSRKRKVPAAVAKTASRTATSRRETLNDRHARKAVERFHISCKGFRGVFQEHFPENVGEVETLAYHLGQFEAQLPNAVEAIRLARYPGAGRRNPKRMALGLSENLAALRVHLTRSIGALEKLANGHRKQAPSPRR